MKTAIRKLYKAVENALGHEVSEKQMEKIINASREHGEAFYYRNHSVKKNCCDCGRILPKERWIYYLPDPTKTIHTDSCARCNPYYYSDDI